MNERIPCKLACGRMILLRLNPDGYCRKCRRKRKVFLGRKEYKKRREERKRSREST